MMFMVIGTHKEENHNHNKRFFIIRNVGDYDTLLTTTTTTFTIL